MLHHCALALTALFLVKQGYLATLWQLDLPNSFLLHTLPG